MQGTEQMSNLAKCQFTITLCLQSESLQRDQRLTTISFRLFGFGGLYCNKKGTIFTFKVSLFIFILTTWVSRYV